MLKRNDFTFKITIVYLLGTLFFNASANEFLIRSPEFSSKKCCYGHTPNSSDFTERKKTTDGAKETITVPFHSLGEPDFLYGESKSSKLITSLELENSTASDVKASWNDISANSTITSDSFSEASEGSGIEYSHQGSTSQNPNTYQHIESYRTNFEHSSDVSSSNNLPSILVDTSSPNVSMQFPNLSSTAKIKDIIETTSATAGSAHGTLELGEFVKENHFDENTSTKNKTIKNDTNSSFTRTSFQDSLNFIFEIFLLNSSEQTIGSHQSNKQTYGSKNYYQLATNNFANESIEITKDIYEEPTHDHSNSTSIQFNLPSQNGSEPALQTWIYKIPEYKPPQNDSFAYNTFEIKPLNNQVDKKYTSSKVSVEESSSMSHSFATALPTITSITAMPFLQKTTVEDLSVVKASQLGEENYNSSLSSTLYNSIEDALTIEISSNITKTICPTNDSSNNELFHYKRTPSHLNVSTVAPNGDSTSSNSWMFEINTPDYIVSKNETGKILEENLKANSMRYHKSSYPIVNKISYLNSEINSTEVTYVDISLVKTSTTMKSTATPLLDPFPSVLLATSYKSPTSYHFAHSEKQHSSVVMFSNKKISESKNFESSQQAANESSALPDSLITNTTDIWIKPSSNQRLNFQNFTDLNNNIYWITEQSAPKIEESYDLLHERRNNSMDFKSTVTNSLNISSKQLIEDSDKGKIFWKPLVNILLPSSEQPPVEEAETERTIIWNLCFTKKPSPIQEPRKMLMTKGPGNTKVFWNLCPTKKPYLTSSYRPTEPTVHASTVSSPLSLFDIPPDLNSSISDVTMQSTMLDADVTTQSTPLDEDITTEDTSMTTDVTTTDAAPEETTQAFEEQTEDIFPVYWNVPTFQCHKYGLNFSRVKDWGLRQNYKDEFRGEEIAILYDPGEFPALLPASGGRRVQRNGGVPQEGSLTRHLSLFQSHLEKLIPDVDFSGLAIIDFEHWRPVWRQNWGSLSPYRDFSRLIEKRRHPFWFSTMVEIEATYRYELGARVFLLDTLRLGKRLRPKAKWGYYGYPFCFNFTPHNNRAACSYEVQLDNDNMYWLFSETTAYYPSLYLKHDDMYTTKRQRFIRGRLDEALRIANGVPVYPYVWYKYHDSRKFLTKEDMVNLLQIPKDYGCKGAVVWGASRDVNSREKCLALQNYLDEVIGPAVKNLRQETFRKGSVEHEEEENPEENFDEEENTEVEDKMNNYDVREFEV